MDKKEKLRDVSELPKDGIAFKVLLILNQFNMVHSDIIVETMYPEDEVKNSLLFLYDQGFIDWYSLRYNNFEFDGSIIRNTVLDPLRYIEYEKAKLPGTPFDERVFYVPRFRRKR
ncbi:MAG: hypothetical protein ABIH25_03885 [Candidatus Woesearchaeota archaeon]